MLPPLAAIPRPKIVIRRRAFRLAAPGSAFSGPAIAERPVLKQALRVLKPSHRHRSLQIGSGQGERSC